jgi:hypothetical protein
MKKTNLLIKVSLFSKPNVGLDNRAGGCLNCLKYQPEKWNKKRKVTMTRTIFLMLLMIVFVAFAFAADPHSATVSAPVNAVAAVSAPAPVNAVAALALPPPPLPWECCCGYGCSRDPENCCDRSESCCKKGGAPVISQLAALAAGKQSACAGKVPVFQFGAEPKPSLVFKQ